MSEYSEWLDANIKRLNDAEVGTEVYVRQSIGGYFGKITKVTPTTVYVKSVNDQKEGLGDVFYKKNAEKKGDQLHSWRNPHMVDMFVEENRKRIAAEKERSRRVSEILKYVDREVVHRNLSDYTINLLAEIAEKENLKYEVYSKLWPMGKEKFGRYIKSSAKDKAVASIIANIKVNKVSVEDAITMFLLTIEELGEVDDYFDPK